MIRVNRLFFSYTKKPFIQDMSFSVSEGEIFGFLGPSGAGKSTLQKILLGMLPSYEGSVMVNGIECRNCESDFYESIGVDFEYSTMYEKLSARENLQFFSSLYKKRARSINELLCLVGLENDADKRVSDYSKGMKSRLNFIKALIHDPKLLFLDEPTSGLDPTNSRMMKDMILEEKRKGKTILLTTHNMQDAPYIDRRKPSPIDSQQRADLKRYFYGNHREDIGMRLKFLIQWDMRFLARYGFYFLYGFLTLLYVVLLLSFPQSWKEKIAAILIFSDPAAMGLFFMGAVIPYFVPEPVSFLFVFLPSFWSGMAIRSQTMMYMLPSLMIAGVWILALLPPIILTHSALKVHYRR